MRHSLLIIDGNAVFVERQSTIIQVLIPESTFVTAVNIKRRKWNVSTQQDRNMRNNVQISGLILIISVVTDIWRNNLHMELESITKVLRTIICV